MSISLLIVELIASFVASTLESQYYEEIYSSYTEEHLGRYGY